jgi:hypothetical protein
MISGYALASLCAIRVVSLRYAPLRPSSQLCAAPTPQENEESALAKSAAPPPTQSNPFDALKKGFESAVQSATGNSEYQFGDATKWVGGKAAGAINEVTGKDTCAPASHIYTTLRRRHVDGVRRYEFGDLSRWLDRSAKAKVNEITGESEYKFGDLSRWLDKSAKDKVAELSSKDQYEFGDLTKLIVSRASQLTMKDATMLLKALLSFNVGLSSVGGLLPIKFLVEVLNYSLLVDVGERLAGMVAVEIDKRVKEALTGDAEYKLGDLTKRAVKSFTRKENYEFGDVSREVMRRFEAELAEELDRWDARFLAARDADATDVG